MKHLYRLLTLATVVLTGQSAAFGQHWAPFRPGNIHSFRTSIGDTLFTLRLDSAYVSTAGDSVYRFNRILRPVRNETFVRTANSFFGSRLVVRPAQREYELVTEAEASRPAAAVLLRPYAAIGSTWPAASGSSLTVTLASKVVQTVAGQPDSIATFALSDGRSLLLSRRNGLIQAPKWLQAGANGQQLRLEQPPVRFAQSVYAPASVFDYQVGDELGYYTDNFMNIFSCPSTHLLRRITSRRQTADSLIYTYVQQAVTYRNGSPGCTPVGNTYSAPLMGRVALAMNGGNWNSAGLWSQTAGLRLLTLEYAPLRNANGSVTNALALPLVNSSALCGQARQRRYLLVNNGPTYAPTGVDYGYQTMSYASGIGVSIFDFYRLIYVRKQLPNGSYQTCGSAATFTTLLPTRAARAAARFELFPNPATQEATLRLLAPAPASTRLTLHDATGRRVGQQEVSRESDSVTVPLTALPAGVYVVQLHLPGEAPVALRLQHLP